MRLVGHIGLAVVLALGVGCGDRAPAGPTVSIGLLLSYSGDLAANSINSERALLMAIEAANAGGGVAGRRVVIDARDTRSDPSRVIEPALELLAAQVPVFIGPDTRELAVQLKALLMNETLILPSFITADSTIYKPHSWFVMGAGARRVACELKAQLDADGRKSPVVITDPNGYDSFVAWFLTTSHGVPHTVLPGAKVADERAVTLVTATAADAFVFGAPPAYAASLFYSLAAIGALDDPHRWYLSPTLHTPALLETMPKGKLTGARGVSTGRAFGATEFRARFIERWQDQPFDDAYPFYDAGAVAVLALQRALVRGEAMPTGTALAPHIVAVTHGGGVGVGWNELGKGLALLASGQEVAYVGVTGALEFDITGISRSSTTNWWEIDGDKFRDIPSTSNCRATSN